MAENWVAHMHLPASSSRHLSGAVAESGVYLCVLAAAYRPVQAPAVFPA